MNFKRLMALSVTPFLLWGCFSKEDPKTEDQLLQEVSQQITEPVKAAIDEYIQALPVKYKTTADFNITVLNTPKYLEEDAGVKINDAMLSISSKGEADESDFTKYASKSTLKIDTKGSFEQGGENISWNGKAAGMTRIVNDAFWFYLTEAAAESSLLPVAIMVPSSVTSQWYTINFEKVDEVLNRYLSTSGLEDVKTFSILEEIQNNSLSGLREKLQIAKSYLDGPALFESTGINPDPTATTGAIAKITEDGKYYELNIQLNKERVKTLLTKLQNAIVANQLSPNYGQLNLAEEEFGDLSGKLTVDVTDSTLFKFEGIYKLNEVAVNISLDLLTKGDLVFTANQDKNSLTISKKGEILSVVADKKEVAKGTLNESGFTLQILAPVGDTVKTLAILKFQKDESIKGYTGSIEVPSESVLIKFNKIITDITQFELEAVLNIDESDIVKVSATQSLESTDLVNIEIPDENVQQIDIERLIEQGGSMIMNAVMGGGIPSMPMEINNQEMPINLDMYDIPITDGLPTTDNMKNDIPLSTTTETTTKNEDPQDAPSMDIQDPIGVSMPPEDLDMGLMPPADDMTMGGLPDEMMMPEGMPMDDFMPENEIMPPQ